MTRCLECNSRIGWLKKRVESVYCSESCRDVARDRAFRRELQLMAQIESERDVMAASERARERDRLEQDARMVTSSDVVTKGTPSGASCPKCGSGWVEEQGAGAFGRNRGHCARCGFHAEFISIEACLHCRCHSLVIESSDDARCPRCKSRPRRRRQIA